MAKLKIHDFKPGMAIEVTFITPSGGRPALNLIDKPGNILLHVNPRWEQSALVLNTFCGGAWGSEERPEGFDFSIGRLMTLRVEAREDCFNIVCNGKVLHKYNYRLPVETVKKITWSDSTDCDKPSQLISITASF